MIIIFSNDDTIKAFLRSIYKLEKLIILFGIKKIVSIDISIILWLLLKHMEIKGLQSNLLITLHIHKKLANGRIRLSRLYSKRHR